MPSMVANILELANANEARMQSGYVSAITSPLQSKNEKNHAGGKACQLPTSD